MRRVAFDIGNVLCRVDLYKLYNQLKDMKVCSIADAEEFLEDVNFGLDIGAFSLENALKKRFDIDEEQLTQIIRVWLTVIESVQQIQDLIHSLVIKHSYHIALLSNIGFEHKKFLVNECKSFTYCIKHFSCDLGVRKPSKLFFQSFLIDNPKFYGALYFDDRIENVEAADAVGLNAQHFILNKQKSNSEAAMILEKTILGHFSNF